MKYSFILLICLCCNLTYAQPNYDKDVQSIDQVITVLYETISGDKGVKRDWDRFRNLFMPEARLLPSGPNRTGEFTYRIISPDEFVASSGKWMEENGFHEVEIHRKTETFGSLVHIWSTYASYRQKDDVEPFARGINSIQLMHDGERWWVIQIYWLQESEQTPIPKNYLPNKK